MEVVRKQSIQSSAIQAAGTLIGALSTLFIYPKDFGLYGIYGFLTNTASLMVPFISLGFGVVLLRYFPHFNNPENKHSGFFGFIASGYLAGILLFTFAFSALYPWIVDRLVQTDPQIKAFVIFILPVTILYVIFDLFTNLSINFQKITVPAITIFLMKLFLPLIFMLCVWQYLSKIQFAWMICLYYLIMITLLILYLWHTGKLKFRVSKEIFRHPLHKPMWRFAIYSVLGGASAVLALRIDSILITSMKGVEANGLFTLAVFISNAAYIPATALTDSLNAVVSSFSKRNDSAALQMIYSKSSRNMLIPTLWIALCIFTGFTALSQLMPNPQKVILIYPVIGWLLLARIVDAATGINHHLLSYSKYYPIELYLLLLMAALNVGFNIIFIPVFGIQGAAFATFLSVCIYNILKTLFVYLKLGIHPISKSLWLILFSGITIGVLVTQLHIPVHPLLQIFISSLMVSICFLGLIYYLRLSPEFNELVGKRGMYNAER